MRVMKSALVVAGFLIASGWALLWNGQAGFAQTSGERPAYLNPKESIESRVEDLLRRMTLEEKVGQLNLPAFHTNVFGKDVASKKAASEKLAAGTYTNEIGPISGFFSMTNHLLRCDVRQQVAYLNEMQRIALTKTRLKIPLLQDEEGTHGAQIPGATIFPEGPAIGSTFDMDLVKSIYAAAAAEARSEGIHILSTLVLELNRDPRMGRNEEGYTEDPYLCSRIAENIAQGTQGSNIAAPDKVIGVFTDFPTQSQPTGGLEMGSIELSERKLREFFLPPWTAAITKSGGLGVMAGYPAIDDVPAHASKKWLTDVLRNELGFRGLVLSEGSGFGTLLWHHIVPTQKEAGALALAAGVDLNSTYEPAYLGPLIQNVKEGRVPEALVDRAVRRVLEQKFRLGLFENPYADMERAVRTVHSAEHQALALRAAREGIVLLKNEGNLLPLAKKLKSIAVIGPNADDVQNLLGDYRPQIVQPIGTVLDGIKAKAGSDTMVVFARGCGISGDDKTGFAEAVRAAKAAEVAVVVVGESQAWGPAYPKHEPATDGEAKDVSSLDLSGVQEDLIRAVYETGTPTVVVLINGRPLSIRWTAAHVPAIVEAWLPGELGGKAVADVLFGDYNPSGRLPVSFPRSSGHLPAYYNYAPSKAYWISRTRTGYIDMPATPLYSFGYGLSYTTFEYSNLRISPAQVDPSGNARVSVDIRNTGSRAGVETAQLYLHEQYTPVVTPIRRLRGFERVSLSPGETRTVTFTLGPDDFKLLDQDMRWNVVPGDFEVMAGRSADDLPLKGLLKVRKQ